MNYAVVGFGRMGRAIDERARARGHRRVLVVDPSARTKGARRRLDVGRIEGVDVAFEFSEPAVAANNVDVLLRAGVAVVCGTTGWQPGRSTREAAREGGTGAVIAPNFSIGMNLFYGIVRQAARRFGAVGQFDAYVWEHHHSGKADAPGGTALRLAEIVARADPRHPEVISGALSGRIPEGALHVSAVRAGREPGTHVVGFDGEFDAVELRHRARSREGFAAGAVVAAEWLVRTGATGVHGFDSALDDLVRAAGGGR